MKTKILKRILAAIIAFSAVIGTSGLSSAVKRMPRKNKQSQSGKKSGYDSGTSSVESEESEESEEGYSVCESFSDDEEVDYEERNYEYLSYFENNIKEEKKVLGSKNSAKNKVQTIPAKVQISDPTTYKFFQFRGAENSIV